jgi:hypothetical protein
MSLSTSFSSSNQSEVHHSARKKNTDSSENKESRDSPSKKHRSQPIIRTPEKKKDALPELKLHELPKPDQTAFDNFKSPVGSISLRGRLVKSPTDAGESPNSARSPQSPRSPRNEYETMSSRRHRIDSPRTNRSSQQQATSPVSSPTLTTTKTVTQTVTTTIAVSNMAATHGANSNMPVSPAKDESTHKVARQRMSSPPNTISLNQPLPEQMNALADLWMQHLLGSSSDKSSDQTSLLTVSKINALGRTDGKIDASALPEVFGGLKVSVDKQGKVSLSSLLNSLLANHLSQSDTGKTIKAMQAVAMHANQKLAAISFDDMIKLDDENKGKEIRQQMADAVIDQASACVDVAFGPSRKLSESHLPQALLDFWQLLDARLVKEAAKNPELTDEQILKARKNLGFDLLVTRQMYPFALKPAQASPDSEVKPTRVTSDTALPVLVTTFATKMSDAFQTAWPSFSADAIASFDA